ncbi:MAG: hypothetical protein EXR72_07175 [Myxococcales bacterium]|nr:hypothetical protein [Myxococcales bacterium]
MPDLARKIEPEKDQRHDGQHDAEKNDEGKQSGQSHLKLQADGKASDAAIKRMIGSDEGAVGGDDGPAIAAHASVGDSGMLTAELKTKLDGNDVTVPKGTYVVVKQVKKDGLLCQVFSNFGGKEAVIPSASFKAEPALGHKSDVGHTTEPRDYGYQEYTSILWDGAPKPGDVAQGRLGDCYLIAAMGAVSAASPKAIMSLFSSHKPNQTTYTVNLYIDDGTGKMKQHPVTIDTALPTRVQDMQNQAPTYALMGKSMAKHDVPLWPALLEKAYAQMMGGYDIIGDKGGHADAAMEAMTGVKRGYEAKPSTESGVLAKFKGFQADGKAIVCGTLGSKQARSQGGFKGQGDGPYHADLKTDQGEGAEIIPGSLSISDKENKARRTRDDSTGKLTGGGHGAVMYNRGNVDVSYDKGGGPAAEGNLTADYEWRGTLDTKLNVHAWHAYIFESVTADGKLQFKNPWGVEHPLPITPADFLRLFTGINVNNVPKDKQG